MSTFTSTAWKARMIERQQNEEAMKIKKITEVNDISFPALGGAGAGWGSATVTATATATKQPSSSYADTLRRAQEASDEASSITRSRPLDTSGVFRHPRFGTSRSSARDTYYDDNYEDEEHEQEPASQDSGWTTATKKQQRSSVPKRLYDDAEPEQYPEPDDDEDNDYPTRKW